MGTFAETVATIQGNIQAAIVDSGIFQDLSDKIANFLPTADEAKEMYGKASDYFTTNILPSIQSTYDWFTGDGFTLLKDSVGGMWEDVRDIYWPKAKQVFTDLMAWWDENWPGMKKKLDEFFAEGGTFDKIMTGLGSLWEEWWPKIKDFATNLFSEEGRKQIFEDLKGHLMSAFGSLLDGVGFLAIGGAITWMLVKAIAKLNPWVKIVGLIIAGLSAFISWDNIGTFFTDCLLYTSPSPRDRTRSRMPSSA